MGSDLSHVVDVLHPVPSEKRLEELRKILLADQNLCAGLLAGSQSAKLNIALQSPNHSSSKEGKRKRALLRNPKEDPSVWKPDTDTIERWSRDPSTFWISPHWTVTFDGRLASIYANTLKLEEHHGENVLRLRFLFVFFYDLLYVLYPQYSKVASAPVYEELASLIERQDPSGRPIAEIGDKVRDWISRGRRYHKLTETFGDGILIELPVDAYRHAVEQRLPLEDGVDFQDAVKGIADLRLKERAEQRGSTILGGKIRRLALQPFLQHPATGRTSSNLTQGNLHTGFGSSYNVRRSNTAADSAPATNSNSSLQIASQSPAAADNSSMSNNVARLSDTTESTTGGNRTKRLCLNQCTNSWSHPVGSQVHGQPQDPGMVLPEFHTPEDTNAGLQGLIAAAELHSKHERSRLGHGERETRNPSKSQLGYSTRTVLAAGGLFFSDSNPSSLPSNTIYSFESMVPQVQAWQPSRQSTPAPYHNYEVSDGPRISSEIDMATDITPSSSSLGPAEQWSQRREYAHDTQPSDVALQMDAPLSLPQLGDMDAWVGTVNATGEQTLALPQLGITDAWAGTGNATGEQVLPLPQSADTDAWAGTGNTMGELSGWDAKGVYIDCGNTM